MRLSARWENRFQPMSRRQAVPAGADSMAGMSIGGPTYPSGTEDSTLLATFRALFDHYRKLGQPDVPGLLFPALIAQTHTLRELSARVGTRRARGCEARFPVCRVYRLVGAGDRKRAGALWWTHAPSTWRPPAVTMTWPRTAWSGGHSSRSTARTRCRRRTGQAGAARQGAAADPRPGRTAGSTGPRARR